MRLLIFDRTCVRKGGGLSVPWFAGSYLYRGLRRIDRAKGVASWDEAFAWIRKSDEPIDELQYWGHGLWGRVMIDREALTADALLAKHEHHAGLLALKERLAPNALVWFRTCSAFGAKPGIAFAEQLSDFLGARVAGHTYVIGFHQSGLHGLAPGARADWDPAEGLESGSAAMPLSSLPSRTSAPHTITCLHNSVRDDWFSTRG
ncbi:MAG TPA: hypothetical protein VGM90_13555 [Kofleriaceae bacterium]